MLYLACITYPFCCTPLADGRFHHAAGTLMVRGAVASGPSTQLSPSLRCARQLRRATRLAGLWPFRWPCRTMVDASSGPSSCVRVGICNARTLAPSALCEWPDGSYYKGMWNDGKREGQGTFTYMRMAIPAVVNGTGQRQGLIYYTYLTGDLAGGMEISRYEPDEPLGENIVWGPNRELASRWTEDGDPERISVERAHEIERRLVGTK